MPRSIFLHTGWRGGGTWLWSRLRSRPEMTGFYEPLNELLAGLRRDGIDAFRPDAWKSGHPGSSRPYFEEFAPLIPAFGRGVAGYRSEFAAERFFADPDDELPELEAYLRSLLDLARSNGTAAAFKFTRSLGRAAWMRQRFSEAVHVAVVRNPWDQWFSAWRQFACYNNPYFIIMPRLVLGRNRARDEVARVADSLKVRLPDLGGRRFQEQYDRCAAAPANETSETYYRSFLALWILTTPSTVRAAQLTIDVDRLEGDYRAVAEREIERLAGIPIDLDDALPHEARASRRLAALPSFDVERCHEDALGALASLDPAPDLAGEVRRTVLGKFADASFAARGAALPEASPR